MLNRVQNSLNTAIFSGGVENGEDDYQQVPVNQLRQVFTDQQHHHGEYGEPLRGGGGE